ncbi:ribosome biogenesis GTP-binding protein YlqF [Lactobacillus selangorensis]|uniref:Ribosome biogenesis GTPase A n=2 Tax=Lactobacillus selangorensis TaxID=81857 RepID=A0A0R2G0F8_9LACO|nr:ribosome biogenesis GTP-binding protein YlqF [Lactobacillus selangorensis]KRN34016.1 ribosome biogenesis GTP-binding protein YlqF [Lactobacillus selangorensis]
MAKAQRQVQEKLKQVDIVFEIVDARVPESSRNPVLDQIIQQKPRLLILNKADLADPHKTAAWISTYEKAGQPAIKLDAQHKQRLPQIEKAARSILADKIERQKQRGIRNPLIKAMCIGIPNVGKSTVLNRLLSKNIAKTGNKPGVTKNQQWLKASDHLALLDTPGILWPKFDDPEVGTKLALTGAIAENIYHPDDVAVFALDFFRAQYTAAITKAYQLTAQDLTLPAPELLLALTKKWGLKDDYDRGSDRLIQEIRKGRLGRYTLDLPPKEADEA